MKRCRFLYLISSFFLIYYSTFLTVSAQYDATVRQAVWKSIERDYSRVRPFFEQAYQHYPSLPKGILESVAFNYTRFASPSIDTADADPFAMPKTYSIMGLTLRGKGVFRENLRLVSDLSACPIPQIIASDSVAILAYAKAFATLQKELGLQEAKMEDCAPILIALSELPLPDGRSLNGINDLLDVDLQEDKTLFPMLSSLYVCCYFLSDTQFQPFGGGRYSVDWERLFGENLPLLKADTLRIREAKNGGSVDYSAAIGCPAASCNYAVGRSMDPTNVVVHYTAGTYSGAIAWFQNCEAQCSAHYLIRSIDGQVTQMVSESDRAWHVGNENGYTIGIEHEAYGNIYSFFTEAMYQSSADLVCDIATRRPVINTHRLFYRDTLDDGTVLNYGLHDLGGSTACTQIRGHQHYPGQTHTDPGSYWDWNYYYKLVNANPTVAVLSGNAGQFTDSGGSNGNYANDERQLTRIYVPGADSVALTFSSFDIEPNYDFLYIYAGDNEFAPLIGRWNTQSPGRVVAAGENMLVEFRSDCSVSMSGWQAQWQGIFVTPSVDDMAQPTTAILWNAEDWVTEDVQVAFQDSDDVALQYRFYQLIEMENGTWKGNTEKGFLCDNFDDSLDPLVWVTDGTWQSVNGKLCQQSDSYATTSIGAHYNEVADVMLFDFYLAFQSGDTCSFFFHANSPEVSSSSFSGFQLVLNRHDRSVSLYRVVNGNSSLLARRAGVYYTPGTSYMYRVLWDSNRQKIKVFRHSSLLLEADNLETWVCAKKGFVGFATRSSSVSVDNLRAYVLRGATLWVTVGAEEEAMIRRQAANGSSTCKLKSIVMDSVGKFSTLVEMPLKVDYTRPDSPVVWDGLTGEDVDAVMDAEVVAAHWSSVLDMHSGVKSYHFYFTTDTTDLCFERIDWHDAGLSLSGTEEVDFVAPRRVYAGVKVENNAGLFSEVAFSNGALYATRRESPLFLLSPNPVLRGISPRVLVSNPLESDYTWTLFDISGRQILQGDVGGDNALPFQNLAQGVYIVRFTLNGQLFQVEKLVVK